MEILKCVPFYCAKIVECRFFNLVKKVIPYSIKVIKKLTFFIAYHRYSKSGLSTSGFYSYLNYFHNGLFLIAQRRNPKSGSFYFGKSGPLVIA